MLLQLLANAIEQRCDFCGARRAIPLDALQAGVVSGDPPEPTNPHLVGLPPCVECGAKEYLVRLESTQVGTSGAVSISTADRNDGAAEHRRAVNALHATLVSTGRIAVGFGEWFASEVVKTERAEIPWSFPSDPVPVVGRVDATTANDLAFAQFLANFRGGG